MELDLTEADIVRFWAKVERVSYACWEWTAGTNENGYGVFNLGERDGKQRFGKAHRIAYTLLVGPIPEGLEPDHLCENPLCCNPDHLEPVTHAVNMQRAGAGRKSGALQRAKTECPQGHAYDEANTFWCTYKDRRPCRMCRACGRERARARKRKANDR